MNNQNQTTELQKAIELGAASYEQVQEASKYVNMQIVESLLQTQVKISTIRDTLGGMATLLTARMTRLIEEDIETMTLETAVELFDKITTKLVSIAEVQRKIAQGKDLMSLIPVLSDEERSYMQMLKLLKTDDEKKKFVSLLKASFEEKKESRQKMQDEFEEE